MIGMTAADSRPVFHLPARDIPVPSSISAEAQAMLAMGPLMPDVEYPPLDDHDAWRTMVAERERQEEQRRAPLTQADRERASSANPWARTTFNLTEQMRITKRDPSLAEQLRLAAEASSHG